MLSLWTLGPFMFMISLCGADSTCPAMFEPPVVIGAHNEEVEFNCSTTSLNHYGMHWEINDEKSDVEDDESFITEYLQLSDWNTTAECIIKLNTTLTCRKKLEIIVYKKPYVMMFPTKYARDLVEGTLLELQCDILEAAPVQNLTVTWYKGNETIKTETFTNTTKKPVDTSSTVMLNISREDHGAQIHCAAQLDFGTYVHVAPSISDTHYVSVLYAPIFKTNAISDYVFIGEGYNVKLNCEAEGNPPPVFNWTRDGVIMSEKKEHLNLFQVEDSAIYNCTASNSVGSLTKRIKVQVTKIPRMAVPAVTTATTATETSTYSSTEALSSTTQKASTPTLPVPSTTTGCPLVLIPATIVVKYGDRASINCSTTASDALFIRWISTIGVAHLSSSFPVTWKVDKLVNWNVQAQCFLHDKIGEVRCHMTPDITLYKTPDSVSVSAVDPGLILEGQEFLLTCNVVNVAPLRSLTLKWYKNDNLMHEHFFQSQLKTPANASATLKVIPKREDNKAAYKCKAELHLGPEGSFHVPTVASLPYITDVHFAPVFNEETDNQEVKSGENVTFHCSAEGNPPPNVHWSFPPAANVVRTVGRRHMSISITGATSTNAGIYICNATNGFGTVTRSVTVIMSSEHSSSLIWLLVLIIICLVIIAFTAVIVTLHNRWKKNGQYSFVSNEAKDEIPMTGKPED